MKPFSNKSWPLRGSASFPHTLTLSLREREQLSTGSGKRTVAVAIADLPPLGMHISRAAARVCVVLGRRMIVAPTLGLEATPQPHSSRREEAHHSKSESDESLLTPAA